MKKNVHSNECGLTLVELLVTIAVASFISILIYNNLIAGMNSYKSVNNQISQHDEANNVMTQFVNRIYVASKVEVVYPTQTNSADPCKFIIKTTNMNGDVTTLGFEKDQNGNEAAVINDQSILPSSFSIVCKDQTYPSITVNDSDVLIDMTIQDNDSKKQFELKNNVSYVNAE